VNSFRNNEFNDKQIKGIDITIKGISKKYPFIKSWKFSKDYKNYTMNLYLDFFIDWIELGDFFKYPKMDDFYKIRYDKQEDKFLKTSTFGVFFEEDKGLSREDFLNGTYDDKKKFTEDMNKLYVNLPKEYQITVEWEGVIGDSKTLVMLLPDQFIQKF